MNSIILISIFLVIFVAWLIVIKQNFYSYYSVVLLALSCFLFIYTSFRLCGLEPSTIVCISSLLTVLVGVSIIVSNVVLVKHEGIRITRFLGVPVFIFGVLSILVSKIRVVGVTAFFLQWLMLAYFIMSYIAVKRKAEYDKDFIIILGCSISKKGGLLPLLKQRTNKAIRFAWDQEIATGKMAKYVPSGGQGNDEVISEGSAIELYLLSHGAENYEVYAEKKSMNTYENMLFSKRIIDEVDSDAKVAFATTNYHVFRSGILARKVGLNAEGIASSTKWYYWPAALIREYVAFLKMFVKENLILVILLMIILR